MDTLEQARAEIDAVDAQLAALFERRMAAVLSVAQYKQAHGLPIFDAAREAVVLEKAAARIRNAALRPYYKDHVQNMMNVAKQYEAEVLGRNRAAYQGVEGAFAHIALRALFPHAEAVSYPTWDEVFDAVSRGDTAHGVVPFENSHAGDVSAVLDLCYNHPELWVVDVYDLPISQNLLVLPGTQLAQLRHVYSHQQAIAQSETFLKQFRLPATAMPNTAMAAKFVAESGDPSKAAIASAETAALYGLEVLVPSINTDGDNTTRFIVLSREIPPWATASRCCSHWTTNPASWLRSSRSLVASATTWSLSRAVRCPMSPLIIIFTSSWWATPPPTRPPRCCVSWTIPAARCGC